MKNNILIIVLLVLTCQMAVSQTQVSPKISEVTVFSTAAEIKSSAQLTLNQGLTTIVCSDISGNMVMNSLKLNPGEGIEITGFSVESYELQPEKLIPGYKQMVDSIALLNGNLNLLKNRLDSYTIERNLLLSNQEIGGDQNGVTMIELKNIADFYRERILSVNNEITKILDDIKKIEEKISDINIRISVEMYKYQTSRKRVIIDVNCAAATKGEIELRYLVGRCGWAANYDLIAEEINKPVKLKYNANVLNNSGIDWSNVQLILSTLDPLRGASAPVLTPFYLSYAGDYYYNNYTEQQRYSQSTNAWAVDGNAPGSGEIIDPTQAYENITVSELSTEFRIERKYTIPSDQKPFKIDITEYDLPAEYKYVSIPKMETKAYLLARITGWEKYDLIDGEMNVYYANSYIGVSRLNTNTVNDTLDLSLGRDNKIMITRIKMENYTSKTLLGTNRKESYAYEIVVKNNRNLPVKIEIIDQVPVSQESEIEVGVENISGAEYNNTTGLLKWNTELQPGVTQKYTLAYWVKYPKSKPVQMNRKRSVAAPKF